MRPAVLRRSSLLVTLLTLTIFKVSGLAQGPTSFAGDYAGKSGPVRIELHLLANPDGSLSGTIDSPDAHLTGVPISDIHVNGNSLSFSVPSIHGAWTGFLSADGKTLSGIYNQGASVQLDLLRVAGDSRGADSRAATAATPQNGSVSEPQYINVFYALGHEGKLIELEQDKVTIAGKMMNMPFHQTSKNIVRVSGAQASARLKSDAQFVVKGRSAVDPHTLYSLKKLKSSGDHREYTILQSQATVFSGSTNSDVGSIAIRFEDYGGTSYRIIPEQPLQPGEYAFALRGGAPEIYCFGVDGAK